MQPIRPCRSRGGRRAPRLMPAKKRKGEGPPPDQDQTSPTHLTLAPPPPPHPPVPPATHPSIAHTDPPPPSTPHIVTIPASPPPISVPHGRQLRVRAPGRPRPEPEPDAIHLYKIGRVPAKSKRDLERVVAEFAAAAPAQARIKRALENAGRYLTLVENGKQGRGYRATSRVPAGVDLAVYMGTLHAVDKAQYSDKCDGHWRDRPRARVPVTYRRYPPCG